MKSALRTESFSATQNACNLCAPLGAALVFKGIANAVPLLHGSQGCSTYIRRYMISHFKEPLDIACSNFAEDTAIFGGGANLKLAIDNIRRQYSPDLIGVATTCLSETIGDDVPMFIKAYQNGCRDKALPALVHVSTPSYQGTHMQGFHGAVRALVATLAQSTTPGERPSVNLFPGMVSPADLRHLKGILQAFHLDGVSALTVSDGQRRSQLMLASKSKLDLRLSDIVIRRGAQGTSVAFEFILSQLMQPVVVKDGRQSYESLIRSKTSVKEDGYLVAGVSRIGENGDSLVLVINAKML